MQTDALFIAHIEPTNNATMTSCIHCRARWKKEMPPVNLPVPPCRYCNNDTSILQYRHESTGVPNRRKEKGTEGHLHAFPFRLSIFHFYDIFPFGHSALCLGEKGGWRGICLGGDFSFPSVKPPSSSCATSGNRARQRRYRQRGCLP